MRLVIIVVVLFIASMARSAFADDASLRAKQYHALGSEHFREGRYEQARTSFAAGYELSKRPGFLWNLAECERILGRKEQAVAHYRQYIEEDPEGPRHDEAQSKLAALAPPPPAPAPSAADPPSAPPPVTSKPSVHGKPNESPHPAAAERHRSKAVIGAMAGGAGLLLSGGVAMVVAAVVTGNDLSEATCSGGPETCSADVVAAAGRYDALLGAGIGAMAAGALAGGALLGYFLWPDSASSPARPAFAPWTSPGVAGGSVMWRF